MNEKLQELTTNVLKKYKIIIGLFIISVVFQLFFRDVSFDLILGSAMFQFCSSFILGYVYTQFHIKYNFIEFIRVWKIFYAILVVVSILLILTGVII
ncbi:hypothetical protein [Marinifilum fragile]|uniref:hypothetical protein n=1 Tax=Marinifilum fragile TaxID=570161 RepID=UPI0006D065FF|nr:hypothetical protein [Marinifilum fragile]